MAFHSAAFLFAFWPACVLACFVAARVGGARVVLVAASLIFYAWDRPINLAVLLASLAGNWLLCSWMLRHPAHMPRVRMLAIAGNLIFLGAFKYGNWLLPVGLSFYTFQQIGLLYDVSAGRVERLSLLDHLSFVGFFPSLLMGPITRFGELMPQLRADFRARSANFSVGISLFVAGLFKKVILADGLAGARAVGLPLDVRSAWVLTVAYTLQIYFDFSGYSDMALGAARVLGVKLPVNFNSPFKASSFVEYWQRWHITLYRFLMSYVYNPILLWLGRRSGGDRLPFVLPTLVTLLVSGLWHGAGLQFVAWGLLHGIYLVVNQAWRKLALPRTPVGRLAGVAITFLAVVFSNALFSAPNLRAGLRVMGAMLGLGSGARVPISGELWGLVAAGLTIVWALPNSQELMGDYINEGGAVYKLSRTRLRWAPTVAAAAVVALLALIALWALPERGDFSYFAF